jgi:hypothetical protein
MHQILFNSNKVQDDSYNFVSVSGEKGKSSITADNLEKFYDNLQILAAESCYHYAERQSELSGVDLDFDIVTDEPIEYMPDDVIKRVTSVMFKTINTSQSSELVIYALYLYKQPRAHDGKTKHSFHIRFPGVMISQQHKRMIVERLIDDEELKSFFGDNFLDQGAIKNAVLIYGATKNTESLPHILHSVYRLVYSKNIIKKTENKTDEFNQLTKVIPANGKKQPNMIIPSKNIFKETSVNYRSNELYIPKSIYDIHPDLKQEYLELIDTQINIPVEITLDEQINNLISDVSDAGFVKSLLDILKPIRYDDYTYWRNIVFILYNTNPNYYPLACYFSMKSKKYDRPAINNLWNLASSNTSSNKIGLGTLIKYAEVDDPAQLKVIRENSLDQRLRSILFNRICDHISFDDIADILNSLISQRYFCDYNNKKETVWIQYMDKDQLNDMTKHLCCKYIVLNTDPIPLRQYITSKLYDAIYNALVSIHAKEVAMGRKVKRVTDFIHDINKLKNPSGIISTIGMYKDKVFNQGILSKLDEDHDVIGVGNGVLMLYPEVKLITDYNQHYVSRYTKVNYKPYDANNPYIQQVESIFKNMFIEDEMDAYEFIMTVLAASLDAQYKAPMFIMLLGEGANGKSLILEFMYSLLGSVTGTGYSHTIASEFFTSASRHASGGPDNEKALMQHARFIGISETANGVTLLTDKIKHFTSDMISANPKYQDLKSFRTRCVYFFCSNFDPKCVGFDWGIWRRIRCIRMNMTFLKDPDPNNIYHRKEDPKIINELVHKVEYQEAFLSILAKWYQDVYVGKYDRSLSDLYSKTVEKYTNEYKMSQNQYLRFMYEVTIRADKDHPAEPIHFNDWLQLYKEWYTSNINISGAGMHSDDVIHTIFTKLYKGFIKDDVLNSYYIKK